MTTIITKCVFIAQKEINIKYIPILCFSVQFLITVSLLGRPMGAQMLFMRIGYMQLEIII